jgi:broad specificity phosphatase PhoE
VIRALVSHVLGIPSERIFRIGVATASITTIAWHGGEPLVEGLNRRPAGMCR